LPYQDRASGYKRGNQQVTIFIIFKCLVVEVGRDEEKGYEKMVSKKGEIKRKRKGIKENQKYN